MGWHLLLTALISCLCNRVVAQNTGEGVRPFLRSSEVARHCALEGRVGNEPVTLHMFLRLSPGPTDNTLKAAGFAFLHGPVSDDRCRVHMTQADAITQFVNRVFLRSASTNQHYPLAVMRSERTIAPAKYRFDTIALWGNWTLDNGDRPFQDYELRVEGFKWFCNVMAAPSPLAAQLRKAQVPSRLWPPVQDPAVGQSSLGPATKVWVLLTTFHEANPAAFSALLHHHFSWHSQLGVHGYILYVQGWLDRLLADPIVQRFISQGRLIVILFEDMGRHEHTQLQPIWQDRYILQIIIENHGNLALWNSDSLMVSIDADEFLMTPRSLQVTDIFKAAAQGVPALAGIVVLRSGVVCKTDASPDCCVASEPPLGKWLTFAPADVEAGRKPHPISCMALSTSKHTTDFIQEKVIVDPNLTLGVFTHHISAVVPGAHNITVSESVLRLGHVVNLYKQRHPPGVPLMEMKGPSENWLWPTDLLLSGNHTGKIFQ